MSVAIQMTLKVFRDFEGNYPERLGEALVINGSKYKIFPFLKKLYLAFLKIHFNFH